MSLAQKLGRPATMADLEALPWVLVEPGIELPNSPKVSPDLQWLWFVDPEARTLSASSLLDGHWFEIGVRGDDDKARIEPFDQAELDLSDGWAAGA